MHRTPYIQAIIDRTGARTYLEIGVFEGDNFFDIRAPCKFAVDPAFRIWRKRKLRYILQNPAGLLDRYYEMPSDDFFARLPHRIRRHGLDVALVDGLHTYAQSRRDVEHCLSHLAPGGVLVLHDCNPNNPTAALPVFSPAEAARQAPPGWDGMWNGDVWKTVVWLRAHHPDLHVFTLNCDFGLCTVTRGTPESRLPYTDEQIAAMTYQDLAAHREVFLNLKPATFAAEFLATLGSATGG